VSPGGYTSGSFTGGGSTPPWHASPEKSVSAARSRKNSAVGSIVPQLQLQQQPAARGNRTAGAFVTVNFATARAVDTQKECPLEVTITCACIYVYRVSGHCILRYLLYTACCNVSLRCLHVDRVHSVEPLTLATMLLRATNE
jgi:hypothetical protein